MKAGTAHVNLIQQAALHLNCKGHQDRQELGAGNWDELVLLGSSLGTSTWQSQGLLEPYNEELETSPCQLTQTGFPQLL